MVVIAIIAVLAAVVAPQVFRQVEKAKVSATVADYRAIKTALMAFHIDTGTWPANQCIQALISTNTDCSSGSYSGWDGPYLEKWPQDKLGNCGIEFRYELAGFDDWDGDGLFNDPAYILVECGIPFSVSQKIDLKIDGIVNNTAGAVHYDDSSITVNRRQKTLLAIRK